MYSVFIQDNIAERECCSVPCKCAGQRGYRGGVGFAGQKVHHLFNLYWHESIESVRKVNDVYLCVINKY